MQLDPGRIASDSDSGRFATSACDAGVDRNRWRALDPSLVMQDTHTERERERGRETETDRQTDRDPKIHFITLRHARDRITHRPTAHLPVRQLCILLSCKAVGSSKLTRR